MARRGGTSSVWPSAMQQIISQPTTHLTTHQSILPKPEMDAVEEVSLFF